MGDCHGKAEEPVQDKNRTCSHCTNCLPHGGWWTSEDGIEATEYLQGHHDFNAEYEDLYAAVQRMPKTSGYAWQVFKAEKIPYLFNRFQDTRPYNMSDYVDREPTYGWSSDEEKYIGPMMERLFCRLPDGCDQTPPDRPSILPSYF